MFCFEFIITEQKSTLCPEDGFILRYYYYVQDFFFLNAVFVHFPFINVIENLEVLLFIEMQFDAPERIFNLKKSTSFQSFKS